MENPPKSVPKGGTKLPIGFRFRPTDEELLLFYLKRKLHTFPLPPFVIPDLLDVFRTSPWNLPGDSREKRYFFCKRERNVNKCNRVTDCGYWKYTGKDEYIVVSGRNPRAVGMKRTLVFCHGKRPSASGLTTHWEMIEYRLLGSEITSPNTTQKLKMEMEDWVVCLIHQKRRNPKSSGAKTDLSDGNKASNMGGIKPSVIDINLMMGDSSELGPPQPSSSCSGVITDEIEVSSKEADQEETSAYF